MPLPILGYVAGASLLGATAAGVNYVYSSFFGDDKETQADKQYTAIDPVPQSELADILRNPFDVREDGTTVSKQIVYYVPESPTDKIGGYALAGGALLAAGIGLYLLYDRR